MNKYSGYIGVETGDAVCNRLSARSTSDIQLLTMQETVGLVLRLVDVVT